MRGKHKFKALARVGGPVQAPRPQTKLTLMEEKIALLTARYVYYLTHTGTDKMLMEDILTCLSKEFFISTKRVADLLVQNSDLITSLRRKAPDKRWFRNQWAHIVWQ